MLSQCGTTQRFTNEFNKEGEGTELQGFVFVNISKIYHHNGKVTIISKEKDTIVHVENKMTFIQGRAYETIDEEYLYRKSINVESFNPEYGLFILRCYGSTNDFYKVEINDEIGLINKYTFEDLIEFKDLERYVMETSPIPTQHNPVRINPNEDSDSVVDFERWTFIPVEISGDWLKVRDNKDCYKGVSPSEKDIFGWIRWRKDKNFILKVAHVC